MAKLEHTKEQLILNFMLLKQFYSKSTVHLFHDHNLSN